jgi:hypothetical protein
MARARSASVVSLPRWIRAPRWDDWLTGGELEARGPLAAIDALYCLGDALDLWAKHLGHRNSDELGLEPVYPRMPQSIPPGEPYTGGPPKWLREAARRSALQGSALGRAARQH